MIRYIIIRFARQLFKLAFNLRYKIKVKGLDLLKDPRFKGKGVLILPNHPAMIEPGIVMTVLGANFNVRPLVTERFYNYPILRFFMRLVKAKPVPEFDKAVSDYKLKKAKNLFADIVSDLDNGHHILLYPSAGLKATGKERIGGRSLAHAIVQDAKDTEILLVRTTGLWGSAYSLAYSKSTPDPLQTLFSGLVSACKNLLFFSPRREVTVELSIPDKEFPRNGSRMEFNRALEDYYNQYETKDGEFTDVEDLVQVSNSMWRVKNPEICIKPRRHETMQELSVPNHIRQDIMYQLSELSEKSVKDIDDYHDLVQDVGLDSLNIASLYSYLDTHYDIDKSVDPGDLNMVQDLFRAAMHTHKDKKKAKQRDKIQPSAWPKSKKKRLAPKFPSQDSVTIIETFLRQCDRMGNQPATTDMSSGVMTFSAMKRAVVILSKKIEKLEGKYIGIMLPASTAAHLFILATMLAGKVPVPLNWTIGPFFMDHIIDLMEIKHVLSSAKFLKRLDNVDLGKALDKLVIAEDLKKSLTLGDKLRGALMAKRPARKIMKNFPAFRLKESDTAIVLLTSGTTGTPKAVPLTHKNILSNQRAAMDCIDLDADDTMIMALPPFHIFGMMMGILYPLVGGRVVYTPDPLDGSTIAKETLKWRVTSIVLAPTFFSHLFRCATLSQLKSLRLFISGAERAPESLVNFISKLGDVWFLEGYGLTETSPIISVNQIYTRPQGVGKVLPIIDLAIRDKETGKRLDPHQIGEVCVRGDSVFGGYYKQDNSDYFVDIDGKSYFRTGDLGYLNDENYLFLEGRMKLSFKRGGEMINVVAIETQLFKKAKEKGWIPEDQNQSPFACIPKEIPSGSTRVVLFTEIPISLDDINKSLLEAGFSRLYKVNEIVEIEKIPMLKSGKVCLRDLYDIIEKNSNGTNRQKNKK